MRCGELTFPAGTTFDPTVHLTPMDVAVDDRHNPSMLKLRLKASKTDQTHIGMDMWAGPVSCGGYDEISGSQGG